MADNSFFSKYKSVDLVYAVLVIVVFLLGIVPAGWYYLQSSQDLHLTQKQLRKAEIYSHLASSIIETKDGEYDEAHRDAKKFFNKLEIEKAKGEDGFLNVEQYEKIDFILDNRDETLAELTKRNTSSLDRLKTVRTAYVKSVGKNAEGTITWK